MNKFFELSQKSDEFESKGWLESYEEGLIESEITKEDYYHESHEISVDLIGQEFGSRVVE